MCLERTLRVTIFRWKMSDDQFLHVMGRSFLRDLFLDRHLLGRRAGRELLGSSANEWEITGTTSIDVPGCEPRTIEMVG